MFSSLVSKSFIRIWKCTSSWDFSEIHKQNYENGIIGEYQCEYGDETGIADHIFTTRHCLQKSYGFNISLHQLYINFEKTVR